MTKTLEQKREHEKYVVSEMIRIYCKGNHKIHKPLCPSCQELLQYCEARVDRCPMMETKTFCSACKIHCYKPDMREHVKQVMSKTGPKVILHNPYFAIMHIIDTFRKAPA